MNSRKLKKIMVSGIEIVTFEVKNSDFISLTDIARFKDKERTNYIIQNWMRNRSTIEFLGLWEIINNPTFKRIDFDAFKNEAGSNSFSLTPQRWIESTSAIGLISKAGRFGGGVFAHKDIAFEFATWISAEFKLFLIKEFQRLKEDESQKLITGWNVKRTLTKLNYKIHTDAIKNHLIPKSISNHQADAIYANEADVLNVALFGKTAKQWRNENPKKEGNIRDYADVSQLVVLANLEGINAELIKNGISQTDRLKKLNNIAISQMLSLLGSSSFKKLKD